MTPALIELAIQELPGVISFVKHAFKKKNPGEPQPTDEQVKASLRQAISSSVAVDEAWLTAHPEDAPPVPVAETAEPEAEK